MPLKTPRQPPARYADPLNLNGWDDAYTLGAFVAKANLVAYAFTHLRILQPDAPADGRCALFRSGAAAAKEIPWADLAYEIRTVRRRCPAQFDQALVGMTTAAFAEMMQAVEAAHDWESERQVRVATEVLRAGLPRGKTR